MRLSLICIVCVLIGAESIAQSSSTSGSADVVVIKTYSPILLQFNPRIDILLKNNKTSFYLESIFNPQNNYNSIVESYNWNIKGGIDYAVTKKLYIGASERLNHGLLVNNIGGLYNYATRLYLQHRGTIGKTLFLKELLYEQYDYVTGTSSTTSQVGSQSPIVSITKKPSIGRVGLGLGFGRYFKAGRNQIAVFVSYRAFLEFDLKYNSQSIFNNRFIDYTVFRLDAGYLLSKSLYIGLYATRDTNYGYIVAATPYDSNTITPILGLACNFILYANADSKEKGNEGFRYFYTK